MAYGPNTQLRPPHAGPNGVFDDGDDVVLALVPQYAVGSTMVTLVIVGVS